MFPEQENNIFDCLFSGKRKGFMEEALWLFKSGQLVGICDTDR